MASLAIAPHDPIAASTRPFAESLRMYWELRGPWNKGQPIHETMTQLSLPPAIAAESGEAAMWEYARGAIWNDDPEGLLFDDRRFKWFGGPTTTNFSSGLAFAYRFKRGERAPRSFGMSEPSLIRRSHFGDLQFLHAMAPDGQSPDRTLDDILRWAEFTADIAIGGTPPTTTLGDIPLLARRFIPEQLAATVNELFLIRGPIASLPWVDVRKRAAGSLLHMVQDSHAAGHTTRNGDDEIVEFHAYGQQDHRRHARADRLPAGRGSTPLSTSVAEHPAARAAVAAGSEVLAALHTGQTWQAGVGAVVRRIFRLAGNARVAGPGEEFAVRR